MPISARWRPQTLLLLAAATSQPIADGVALYDSFTTYNSSLWSYADQTMGTTDKCRVWYLKNHSQVNGLGIMDIYELIIASCDSVRDKTSVSVPGLAFATVRVCMFFNS